MRAIQRPIILALVLFVLAACSARHIRDAQDHFSRGAAAENQALLEDYPTEGVALAADPAMDYRLSLALLNKELDVNESKLRGEGLYGTALMLKAMSLWRLADLEDRGEQTAAIELAKLNEKLKRLQTAEAAARIDLDETRLRAKQPGAEGETAAAEIPGKQATLDNAAKAVADARSLISEKTSADQLWATLQLVQAERTAENSAIRLGQRDVAMLHALPGLRDHDRGLRADDYERAKAFFESSLAVVQRTIDDETVVPAQHPVAIYLRIAMLSTCRAWTAAAFRAETDGQKTLAANGNLTDEEKERLTAELTAAINDQRTARIKAIEILKQLKEMAPKDTRVKRVANTFVARLGITPAEFQWN